MQHRMNGLCVTVLALLAGVAHAELGAAVPKAVMAPIPRPAPALPACVDPALASVHVRDIYRQADGSYDFTLVGVVRNAGTADFRTSPAQQEVQFYRRQQGVATGRPVQAQGFASLRVGEQAEARLRYIGWRVGTEFPPAFELVIAYDPDIAVDGNAANDDCRSTNNRRTLMGDEINAQIRASGR